MLADLWSRSRELEAIAWELFRMSALRNLLIDEAVDHIRANDYTSHNMPHVTDMHHRLKLMGIYNIRKIQYDKKHTKIFLFIIRSQARTKKYIARHTGGY
jgi:hypothetical protein